MKEIFAITAIHNQQFKLNGALYDCNHSSKEIPFPEEFLKVLILSYALLPSERSIELELEKAG